MLHNKSVWLIALLSLVLLGTMSEVKAQKWNPSHSIGPVSGKFTYQYGQTPDQMVEIYPATIVTIFGGGGNLTYEWQVNYTANEDNFVPISGANQSSYSPGALIRTTYYRRKTTRSSGDFIFSNTVKLTVVSDNWVDRNYLREFEVKVTGVTTTQAVDQLSIGQKLETTTYLDGLGRGVQKVSRETAIPTQQGGLWGDVVEFYQYNELGLEVKKYLPYTTVTEAGKFKTTAETEQAQYYAGHYNETSPFTQSQFEANPLNRESNVKDPGVKWAASGGNSFEYGVNSAEENVQQYIPDVSIPYGTKPRYVGPYEAGTLIKHTYIDKTEAKERKVIEYYTTKGQLILKKIQLEDAPSVAHAGWLCTYTIYDLWGNLKFQYQPEAVKYLDTHGWDFLTPHGVWIPEAQQVFNEWCYRYDYDWKNRVVYSKAPGAQPLKMLYDVRDRLVFSQDGTQAVLSTPQWTAYLYDEIDRPVTTALYNTTKTSDQLQADIDNAVTASPITAADLNNPTRTTITKYQFYDDYSFASAKPFNSGFTNLSAYGAADPNVQPIVPTKRTLSLPTGSLVRVLGSNTFLGTTLYYDENERVIQSQDDNIKAGIDITTWQYHFDGRVLSKCSDHTTAGTGYNNFINLTKNYYDKLGRIASIENQFGNNPSKMIASYDYDDLGRLKTKHLDPGYTAGGNSDLESLDYSYNLQSQLTGINKDYALKNPASYDKWGHFFGMYLGYDNADNIFSKSRLNGQVTGVLWNTQGDDVQRKYDYTYDNVNRLASADFTEQKHPGEGWSNAKMDFSVNGNGGKINYDLNGNLLSLVQKGVFPGMATPVTIDDLTYSYENFSNRLKSVTDHTLLSADLNGKLGDFKNSVISTGADYVYDNNGNLVIDLNKNIKDLQTIAGPNGISYNYLNKPESIRISGKGTIRMVYSADGDKLQRAFIPESGDPASVTTYIDEFVYQQTGSVTTTVSPPFLPTGGSLSYVNFEEGRIRVIDPVVQNNNLDALQIAGNINLPNAKMGVYDYFIYDYLHSVRMILTEETHAAFNTCTMETSRQNDEDPVFGQTGSANEVESTRYSASSTHWQSPDIGSSVSQLGNNAGHNIGPNTLQKVMAGDKVSASVQYYYQAATGGDNPNIVSTLLTSLGQAIIGGGAASDLVKSSVAPINNQLNGVNGFLQAVHPASDGTNTPRAYLTALFFDERFNFIEAVDGGVMQQQVAASVPAEGALLGWGNFKAPKNGYVYVYVSNQSDQDVYFDNMKVGITRGNIIEENHYYAFGLKISGISSQKPGHINEGTLKNNYRYQGDYSEMDDDLGWSDFTFRSYDVQIGRWLQIDIVDRFTSPYAAMDNDPISNTDPDGADPLPVPFIWKIPDEIMKGAATGASTATTIVKPALSAGAKVAGRVASGVASRVVVSAIDNAVSKVVSHYSSTFINIGETTNPVGVQPQGQKLDRRFSFVGATAKPEVLSQTAINVLNYIIAQAKVSKLTIHSTGRTPKDQARVMFENLEHHKSSTYAPPGMAVIQVYKTMKKAGASDGEIKQAMFEKIMTFKSGAVSAHTQIPSKENAIDFGIEGLKSDIGTKKMQELSEFLLDLKAKGILSNFLYPGNNTGERAFHLQVLNKDIKIPGQQNSQWTQRPFPWNSFNWITPR
jgi:RHS repeat-associated protein